MDKTNIAAGLTVDDQRQAVRHALGRYFDQQNSLYLPTTDTYNSLHTDEGVLELGNALYRWLGVKPRNLRIHFSDQPSSLFPAKSKGVIEVPVEFRNFPYLTAAAVTFGTLRHFLCDRHRLAYSDQLLEIASIETGFGVLVLNALVAPHSKHQQMHHLLSGHHHQISTEHLRTITNNDYALLFDDFCQTHELTRGSFDFALHDKARALLRRDDSRLLSLQAPFEQPAAMKLHQQAARKRWLALSLIAITTSLVGVIVTYTMYQRPYTPSYEVIAKYEQLSVLHKAYNTCADQAKKQQDDPATHDDIFLQRQLDGVLLRCQSLKNQYNYEVDNYNSLIQQD